MKASRVSLVWLVLLLLLVGIQTSLRAAPEVEWLVQGEALLPTTTLEVRFARDMVSREQLGIPGEAPLLRIEPPLAGQFTWLSRRSGVFVPAQAPTMGATFVVTLAPDLKDAAGKPLTAKFRATLRTPAFDLLPTPPPAANPDGIRADMEVRLAFNRDVKIEGAEALFRFASNDGKFIAATVRYAVRRDYFQVEPQGLDWEERWQLGQSAAPAQGAEDDVEGDDDEAKAATPQRTRLIIKPAVPLTAGRVWRLEMKPGLAALKGEDRIKGERVIAIGKINPFTLLSAVASSYLNSGRSIALTFSESLAPDVEEDTAHRFFRITPEVKNLAFAPGGETLTIQGEFDPSVEYRLEIDPALLASSGLALSGERQRVIHFPPVKPRIYLPEITGHQLLGGRRKFSVLSVNLKALRLVARLVEPEQAARAVIAFEKYDKQYDPKKPDEIEEVYQALPAGLIAGRVIAQRTIALPEGPRDSRQETLLDWDEIVGPNTPGLVFLTVEGQPAAGMTGKAPAAQTFMQITDLGLLWKKGGPRLNLSVFSMGEGKPLAGARVGLFDEKFAELSAGESDAAGAVTLEKARTAKWALVRHGKDAHVVRIGQDSELAMAAFNVPIEYSSEAAEGEETALRALIFTDRPLYRPGESVQIKGLVRTMGDDGLQIAAGLKASLVLVQPHERKETTIEVQTDERGAFHTEVKLDDSVVGGYGLRLKVAGSERVSWQGGSYTGFQVADFQPNAFELKVSTPDRFAPEAPVTADVAASYLFGAKLGASPLRWTLQYATEDFSPEGFASFSFNALDHPSEKTLTLHGEGALAPDGTFSIRPHLPVAKERVTRGLLTVEVTDLNQQTVSEGRAFLRDGADFYLGLKQPEEFVIGHAQEIVARAVAVRPDGQPVTKPLAVKVQLVRQRYATVRVQGAGGAVTFHSEKSEEVVATAEGSSLVPLRSGEEWRLPDGETARFKPARAGQYLLRATAQDEAGRSTTAEVGFSVSGTEAVAWNYRNAAQIELVPDKGEYRVGDTARVLIKSPFSGEAMVTVERGSRILRTLRISLEGNTPVIEVPIEPGDGPNVALSLLMIRGAAQSTRKIKAPEYRYGLCQLRIADPATDLKVEVLPQTPTVQPGEEIVTEVRVHDGNGKAVSDAEVTFYAVDDGILALTDYERPAPRRVFDTPLPLAIRTGLSLYELLPEDPADLTFTNKGYLIGGGGVGGPGIKLRKDFPGTACWLPTLRTDAAGKVTARFKAPDALTRYRLVAVVHAGANQFGSGESAVQIRKKLMILSALGQAAHVGDEILVQAVVRNESGASGLAEVTLALDGTAQPAAEPLVAKLPLQDGETGTVRFPVRLRAMGAAAWQWTAHLESAGAAFNDGLVVSMRVGSPAPLLRETYLSELPAAENDVLEGVNPQLLEGEGTVRVSLSNTRLASLREPARELLEYPYGCLEQTVSALLPWIVSGNLGPVLGDLGKTPADTEKAIRAGTEKIFANQTAEGGIPYWPGSHEGELFPSAYALMALAMIKNQGTEMPQREWPRLIEFVGNQMAGVGQNRGPVALSDRALALYALALAGEPEQSYNEVLYGRRAELSLESRAFLALAIHLANGPAKMVSSLLEARADVPESLTWFGSATRERAVRLMAWSAIQPKDREVGRLVKELLAARVNGHWRTTQENAWALLALSQYFSAVEGAPAPVKGALVKAGVASPFALDQEHLSKAVNFAFDPTRPLGTLAVENPAKGRLYGEAAFVVRPPVADQPRQDRGYAVSRSYRKLAADGSLQEPTDLQVGDRVLVNLRVETPTPGHFVAIDDPLPAILEAINPEFRTAGGAGEGRADRADYREIRADRVLYFCDHLPAGAYQFQYLARVRMAGKVIAPATKVEEMYRPERFGLSATSHLESRATGK